MNNQQLKNWCEQYNLTDASTIELLTLNRTNRDAVFRIVSRVENEDENEFYAELEELNL